MIIKSIRIEKLAYQGECRRLLIGAVTHVLIKDPTKGYGIFIENMLSAAE